tara:strand:- start:17 stop:1171 length:1155 start_codon:yes stop_codon:yes gene_type:complete
MKILDLFSGIGGFSYAAERLVGGFETVAFCEQDEFCKKILNKHWPTIPIINDVKELADNANEFRGIVDIVCGGFPCQPVSVAGLQRADQDDRYLWEEMFRVIQGCQPKFVIAENVTGLINIKGGVLFESVQADLESEGYSVQSIVLPAASKNAPHRRDRIWIIGRLNTHTNSNSESNDSNYEYERQRKLGSFSHSEHNGLSSTKVRGKHEENGRGASQGQKKTEQSEGTSKRKGNVTMAHTRRKHGVKGNATELDEKQTEWASRTVYAESSGERQSDATDTDSQRGRGRQTKGQDAENVRQSPKHQRTDGERMETGQSQSSLCGVDDGISTRLDGFEGWEVEPEDIPRVATGIKNRTERLKSLGNSIVPQVVAEIFRAIKETEQ